MCGDSCLVKERRDGSFFGEVAFRGVVLFGGVRFSGVLFSGLFGIII